MGLNALVTHGVARLVKQLTLEGDWTAGDLEEHSRVGRVSEQLMMMSIVLRAAIDRCSGMEAFKWQIDSKLQPNVYTGLAALKNLKELWLRFPSSRAPQKIVEVPALVVLEKFTFTDYDPLCFPDDVSGVLVGARGLRELQMHFSPRMRKEGEVSVQLSWLLRRNINSRRKMRLKKMGLYNLFARAEGDEMGEAVEVEGLEELVSLNSFGGDEGADVLGRLAMGFVDGTWQEDLKGVKFGVVKSIRMDCLHRGHGVGIGKGLERLYLVNARYGMERITVGESPEAGVESSPSVNSGSVNGSAPTNGSWTGTNTNSNRNTPATNTTTSTMTSTNKLKELYFDQICEQAGPTLKHLIFPARWGLSIHQMARLIRSCPNLTQLSCYFDCVKFEMLRMLVPFLSKLWAIRLIVPDSPPGELNCREGVGQWTHLMNDIEHHERKMRIELAKGDFQQLKYVGLGKNIWEVQGIEEVVEKVPVEVEDDGSPVYRDEVVLRRTLKRLTEEDVRHVEIWSYDTLDVL